MRVLKSMNSRIANSLAERGECDVSAAHVNANANANANANVNVNAGAGAGAGV